MTMTMTITIISELFALNVLSKAGVCKIGSRALIHTPSGFPQFSKNV